MEMEINLLILAALVALLGQRCFMAYLENRHRMSATTRRRVLQYITTVIASLFVIVWIAYDSVVEKKRFEASMRFETIIKPPH